MAIQFFKIPDPNQALLREKGINPGFVLTRAAIQVIKSAAFQITEPDTETAVGVSTFGLPVMDRLTIAGGDFIDLEGNTITFPGIVIDAVIFEVNQTKNIVKTPIQGRNGTIKEYVSDGDFEINARGLISDRFNVLPLDELRNFREIMSVPQQLEVTSQFLNEIFEINEIVINTFKMPQVEGRRNEIPFTFQALSDVPLDLEELE